MITLVVRPVNALAFDLRAVTVMFLSTTASQKFQTLPKFVVATMGALWVNQRTDTWHLGAVAYKCYIILRRRPIGPILATLGS
jgi:hypothetical protein